VLYLWKTKKTTWHIFECEGSTVKGLTLERYKQMIGKEGPQTDDMNSVSQSVEIVKKWKKIKTIVNKYGWEDNLHSRVSGNGSAQVQVQVRLRGVRILMVRSLPTDPHWRSASFGPQFTRWSVRRSAFYPWPDKTADQTTEHYFSHESLHIPESAHQFMSNHTAFPFIKCFITRFCVKRLHLEKK